MIKIANAINSFASVAQQVDVQPSEESIFVLTSSKLQEILARALQPLQGEVRDLKDIVADLSEKIAAMEATQEQDVNRLSVDIALDRQRLSKLEQREPQPLQRDRGEILRALIATNGGKMLAKDARQKMRLPKNTFSELLNVCGDNIGTKSYHLDQRQLLLFIKPT